MLYGDSYSTWKQDLPTCQNCGKPSDNLVMLGNGWDYLACPKCAAEAAAVDLAETGCSPEEIHRITIQPVRIVTTAQGNLFPQKEIA